MLLSEALGTTESQLWKLGVHDTLMGVDSLFHVDPARLRSTRVPELRGSYSRLHRYFAETLDLIAAAGPGDALERQAIRRLVFPEVREAALGYSAESTSGRGVTWGVARNLYQTAKAIIDAGIKNPAIFELAVLFEERFGADMISDMTVFLLLEELSRFNERAAKNLGLSFREKWVKDRKVVLLETKETGRPVLLIPSSILADLPLALDWSGIDAVSGYNQQLRTRINVIVQKAWGKRWSQLCKADKKRLLLDRPDLLRELIDRYEKAEARPYDFEGDPRGVMWRRASQEYARTNPLPLEAPKNTEGVYAMVLKICEHFKHLIEQQSLAKLIFDEDGRPKLEKAGQLLFFGIADAYCRANNIDISREPQTGRGLADFKLSRGYHERVIVELKLSSNAKYLEGLTVQLPTYLKAEEATHGVLLLIQVGQHTKRLATIRREYAKLKTASSATGVPELLVIDATAKPTASKLSRRDVDHG